jgi:hypothetical protein
VRWLSTQPQRLGSAEIELIKLAAEEPETCHVHPRAADTFRVMQRFERLMSQVGPLLRSFLLPKKRAACKG